jgi:hypothetical protein
VPTVSLEGAIVRNDHVVREPLGLGWARFFAMVWTGDAHKAVVVRHDQPSLAVHLGRRGGNPVAVGASRHQDRKAVSFLGAPTAIGAAASLQAFVVLHVAGIGSEHVALEPSIEGVAQANHGSRIADRGRERCRGLS